MWAYIFWAIDLALIGVGFGKDQDCEQTILLFKTYYLYIKNIIIETLYYP